MENEWIGKTKNKSTNNEQNCKNQCQKATCKQKTTSEKATFCSNSISHSTLKFERNLTPKKHSRFPVPT